MPGEVRLGYGFVISMMENMLGLNEQERATIEAAMPVAESMLARINANQALWNELLADWGKVGPAVQIVVSHLNKK